MTIGIASIAVTAATSGTNPISLGVATGIVISGITKLLAFGPAPAAAAVGISTATSAVLAALTTKTFSGSLVSALSGAGSSSLATWISGIAAGPLGAVIVGTTEETANSSVTYRFDCWRRVMREQLELGEESRKMPLKDLLADERVKEINIFEGNLSNGTPPQIKVTNIWDEQFLIDFMMISYKEQETLTAHATQLVH